jgi:CsoR family transcriptional regulator, copper-sensing transcriptional repressor
MVFMRKEIQSNVTNRLRRIEGQVRGLQKMVDEKKYCIDIITQSSAIRSALSAVEDLMLENHLSEHVIHQMKQGQEKKAVGEIISVFKKSKKK